MRLLENDVTSVFSQLVRRLYLEYFDNTLLDCYPTRKAIIIDENDERDFNMQQLALLLETIELTLFSSKV